MNNVFTIILFWNIFVMIVYGLDKLLAVKQKRRISEFTLLLLSFAFGGFGAVFGMVLFNHKTSKLKFRIFVPLSIIVGIIIICSVSTYKLYLFK